MYNTGILVKVFQCIRHLDNDMSGEVFAKVRQADNLVEKLATWAELEDDVVVLSRLGEIDQADDVGVVELAHDLDFFEDVGSLKGANDVSSRSCPKGVGSEWVRKQVKVR